MRRIAAKVDEHERGLSELRDQSHMQELHLARVDAALDMALSAQPQSPEPQTCDPAAAAKLAELLEALGGQAKAVEDLELIVREELCLSRELTPPPGDISQQLLEQAVEQGQAIAELSDLVAELGACLEKPPAAEPTPAQQELEGRVAELEGEVGSIQQHLGALVTLARQVRDHAADALEDRVAIAVNEVAPVSERADRLREVLESERKCVVVVQGSSGPAAPPEAHQAALARDQLLPEASAEAAPAD